MGERIGERIRPMADPVGLRHTTLAILHVVSHNPVISQSGISERSDGAFALIGEDRLPFGLDRPWPNLEQFLLWMAGNRQGLLKKIGVNGTSAFEIGAQGKRTLAHANLDRTVPTNPVYF